MEVQTKLATAAKVLSTSTKQAIGLVEKAGASLDKVRKAAEHFDALAHSGMEIDIMSMVDSPNNYDEGEDAEEEHPEEDAEVEADEDDPCGVYRKMKPKAPDFPPPKKSPDYSKWQTEPQSEASSSKWAGQLFGLETTPSMKRKRGYDSVSSFKKVFQH